MCNNSKYYYIRQVRSYNFIQVVGFKINYFIVGFSAIVGIVKIVLTIYIMYLPIKALRKYIDA